MTYRTLARKLRRIECEFIRPAAGSHKIWWRPDNKHFTTIPRHGNRDIPTGTLRAILRDLAISKDKFDHA